jgi:hypothetical protein
MTGPLRNFVREVEFEGSMVRSSLGDLLGGPPTAMSANDFGRKS